MLTKWDSVTYLFPPVPLLTKVLHKLCMEKCTEYKMTLIMDPASGVTLADMVASLVMANHVPVQNPNGKFPYIMKLCFSSSKAIPAVIH